MIYSTLPLDPLRIVHDIRYDFLGGGTQDLPQFSQKAVPLLLKN